MEESQDGEKREKERERERERERREKIKREREREREREKLITVNIRRPMSTSFESAMICLEGYVKTRLPCKVM